MTLIPERHPYWTVRELIQSIPEIAQLRFSHYLYRPQSLIDERDLLTVNRDLFLSTYFIESLVERLPRGHELAFHSNVSLVNGQTFHIPMIDMASAAKAHVRKLRTFIGGDLYDRMTWFDSGRSFHGYGLALIDQEGWIKLMGALLLSNQRDLKPTADPRWIGHRLIAGYAALRWTSHTDTYLHAPSKITVQL
ncbi:primase 1D-like protein [Zemynaea arenosa]|uniref:primase 1D-like protein n=1 Tax=Zemynaea arenosa TaxID=2561931 RepID=UPI003F9385A4